MKIYYQRFWVCFVGFLLMLACSQQTQLKTPPPYTQPPADFDSLEPQVQDQYRGYHQDLAAALKADASRGAEALGRLGMWFQTYRYSDKALACYDDAQKMDPAAPAWPYFSGLIHKRQGRLEEALTAFQQTLEREPPNRLAVFCQLGEIHYQMGSDADSEWAYNQAKSLQADSPAVFFGLGKVYLRQGNLEQAEQAFRRAVALAPGAVSAQVMLGQVLMRQNRAEEARRVMPKEVGDKRETAPPGFPDPLKEQLDAVDVGSVMLVDKATALYNQGQLEEALEQLRLALRGAEGKAPIRLKMAKILIDLKRPREAYETYLENLELFPNSAATTQAMALFLVRHGRAPEAEPYFKRTLELDPNHTTAAYNYGLLLIRSQRTQEALELFDAALAKRDDMLVLRIMRLACLLNLEQYARFREHLDADLAQFPTNREILFWATRFWAAAPQASWRRPKEVLDLVARSNPEDLTLAWYETRNMALAADGQFQLAAQQQERLVNLVAGRVMPAIEAAARQRLAQFKAGQPATDPWLPQEPLMITRGLKIPPP